MDFSPKNVWKEKLQDQLYQFVMVNEEGDEGVSKDAGGSNRAGPVYPPKSITNHSIHCHCQVY